MKRYGPTQPKDDDMQWAHEQREKVAHDIDALLGVRRAGGSAVEVVGVLPVQARLQNLRHRLRQIDSLISVSRDNTGESGAAWPEALGVPDEA